MSPGCRLDDWGRKGEKEEEKERLVTGRACTFRFQSVLVLWEKVFSL